jgi:hypothetical protein
MKRIDENHSFNINVATHLRHIEKAILLKEIYGWCLRNAQKRNNIYFGIPWSYDTAKSLSRKFPYMTSNSISRWLKQLEEEKWMCATDKFNKFKQDRTHWRTIDFERYDMACLGEEKNIEDCFKWYDSVMVNFENQDENKSSQNEECKSQNEECKSQNQKSHFSKSKMTNPKIKNHISQNGEPLPPLTTSYPSLSHSGEKSESDFKQPELDIDKFPWQRATEFFMHQLQTHETTRAQVKAAKQDTGWSGSVTDFKKLVESVFTEAENKRDRFWHLLILPGNDQQYWSWLSKVMARVKQFMIYRAKDQKKETTNRGSVPRGFKRKGV